MVKGRCHWPFTAIRVAPGPVNLPSTDTSVRVLHRARAVQEFWRTSMDARPEQADRVVAVFWL